MPGELHLGPGAGVVNLSSNSLGANHFVGAREGAVLAKFGQIWSIWELHRTPKWSDWLLAKEKARPLPENSRFWSDLGKLGRFGAVPGSQNLQKLRNLSDLCSGN